MNDLEKMLREDLRLAASSVDAPVSLDAVAAQRDRLDRAARRGRWTRWALATVVVLLLAAGLWWAQSTLFKISDSAVPNPLQTPGASADPTPAASAPATVAPSPTATRAAPTPSPTASPTASGGSVATIGRHVYFAGAGQQPHLVRELRQVSAATPARGALEAMLAGPSDPDYRSLWNPATTILGISKNGDVITVDLSPAALDVSLGASYEALMVDQLVYTVTEAFAPTDRVQLLVEGRPFETGHNRYADPLARAVAPDSPLRVVIDTPVQGASVASPVRVTGLAAAFEATITWQVTHPDGSVVAEGVGHTQEGMTLAPYSLALPDLPAGTYTVTVTLDDPSGGEGPPPLADSKEFTVR